MCRLCGPGGALWATDGTFWARFGGMDQVPPTLDNNGPASMVEREGRARGGTGSGGSASSGMVRLGNNPS